LAASELLKATVSEFFKCEVDSGAWHVPITSWYIDWSEEAALEGNGVGG
jgi:hypothetical protein